MEWRFRISGTYLWGDAGEDAGLRARGQTTIVANSGGATALQATPDAQDDRGVTKLPNNATVTRPPGHLQTPGSGNNTIPGRQAMPGGGGGAAHGATADADLGLASFGEELPDHAVSHSGEHEIEDAAAAGAVTPTLTGSEHGALAGERGDVQKMEGLSLQIASLVSEAELKDARLKALESDLHTKRSEYLQAQQQVTLLLDEAKAKDARLEELESNVDTNRDKHSKAQEQVASLLDEARAKSARVEELESSLGAKCSEHSEALQQLALLLDEARVKDVRAEELESMLASERSERLTIQQLYASLRKTIRVMVRVRPPLSGAKHDGGAAGWNSATGSGMLEITPSATQSQSFKCRFDRVFRPQAGNNEVFDETLPLVRLAATEGARCVIMAYGASSTGKSYTMRGDDKASPPTPGIIQLAGRRIFEMRSSGGVVDVSSMYAYNGEVWDLLVAPKDRNLGIPATQRACTPDTRYERVRSADELVGYFDSTMSKTVKAATLLNADSSRGHYFFTVRVGAQQGDAGAGLLTFVDLAGNESVKESGVEGEQFKESRSINADLFALGEMIRNLRQGLTADTKRSKLTQLLAGAMGLGTKTTARSEILVLTTVNLSDEHMQKSLRTLRFAKTAIKTPAKKSKS